MFAAVAASAPLPVAAAGENYWKGEDGADLSVAANWTSGTPTSAAGYFDSRSPHDADYTATLSADASFSQFIWDKGTVASTIFSLDGKTLTLTQSGARPLRLNTGSSVAVTVKNGTLSFTGDKTAWVLGSDQTLTFGEGLTFNGDAAIRAASATPSTNSAIVARDGAKVNGRLYFGDYNSSGTILVTGEGTVVDASGQISIGDSATNSNNVFRVENGAVVTNLTGDAALSLGYGDKGTKHNRLVVDSGASLYTKDWESSSGNYARMGKAGVAHCGNEIFVGDGASFCTRALYVSGNGNALSISNGAFRAAVLSAPGTNAFHFAGAAPLLSLTKDNSMTFGDGSTFSFDVPAAGWTAPPLQSSQGSAARTVGENTVLVVDAREFRRRGGGTVPLAKYVGTGKITFPDALLSRWNGELAVGGCSVEYDSKARTLYLKVRKPGFVIAIR